MGEFRVAVGWNEHVGEALTKLLDEKIGPAILSDMKAGCPVDTSRLVNSLDFGRTDDSTLRIGSKDVPYSVYVNEGHRIVYRNRQGKKVDTGRVQPPQDFMRPALYRERGE